MAHFELLLSGDFLDADGQTFGDLALDLLAGPPPIRHAFIESQRPKSGDASYQDRLYNMQIEPDDVAAADAIVICRPWVKPTAFAKGASRLVCIGRAGIGYDKIDLAACTAHDVIVFNSPYGLTHSTASAALIFMLTLARKFNFQQELVRTHRWDRQKEAIGLDLAGCTLGIAGLGKTGMELARLCAPFQMRIIAFSPHADPAEAAQRGVTLVDNLDDVLHESDFFSLHGRLTPQTHGMIGAREFALMKPTAYFINVARGEMIDEKALIAALREHRIAGAGLDVFEHEPLPSSNELLALDNVILTPHWLCSTQQALRKTMADALGGILRIARGQLPENILNPSVVNQPGFLKKLQRFA
jgi:phosphoglycerate dehydrogenase-like enzyme